MIKNFKDFINESIRDKMKPKSDEDIDTALSKRTKDELIQLYFKRKDEGLLKYIYKKFDIKNNPLNLDINKLLNSYLQTGLWINEADDVNVEDGDNDFINDAIKDIELFVSLSGDLLIGIEESDIGHNLWLTRNGHGAGFWDMEELDKEQGEKLSDIARGMGEVYIENGYDIEEDEDTNESIRDKMTPVSKDDLRPDQEFEYDVRVDADEIISNFKPIATKIENNDGFFSVLIKDKNSNFSAWLDIWLENDDLNGEWNQDTFYLNNSKDMIQKRIQDEVFEEAESVAISKLKSDDLIYQGERGFWFYK